MCKREVFVFLPLPSDIMCLSTLMIWWFLWHLKLMTSGLLEKFWKSLHRHQAYTPMFRNVKIHPSGVLRNRSTWCSIRSHVNWPTFHANIWGSPCQFIGPEKLTSNHWLTTPWITCQIGRVSACREPVAQLL
jgi:hypothetical protein